MNILFEERVAWLKFSDKNKEIQVQYIFHTRRLPTIRFLERKKERKKKKSVHCPFSQPSAVVCFKGEL